MARSLDRCVSVLILLPIVLPQIAGAQPKTPVEVQMRGINYHVDETIVLEIRSLRGQMIATHENEPVTFDDVSSLVIKIGAGEIAMTAQGMSDLMNRYVFAYPGAPLKHIAITIERGRIKQKGTMHKGVDVPFEIDASLGVTPEGEIRLHADKV